MEQLQENKVPAEIQINTEAKTEQSAYVLDCQKLILDSKTELINQIEMQQIDAQLKIDLAQIIEKHFNGITFSDYSNASGIGIFVLGTKIFDAIREFKLEAIGTQNSFRYAGTEEALVESVVNPIMMELGAKINEREVVRNSTKATVDKK